MTSVKEIQKESGYKFMESFFFDLVKRINSGEITEKEANVFSAAVIETLKKSKNGEF